MLGRVADNRITIDVPYERLKPGPVGSKVAIVDYDSTNDTFYPPVDLDSPDILMNGGLDPSEGDPLFHQQMTYSVVVKVIENFERSLGREIRFRKGRALKVFPHAFRGSNAFYDYESRSLFFGYFRADENDPGANLPQQWVFTCLSHDIVAHETTHAIIDKLRYRYRFPTNVDSMALHEGIADIVAIFQHFTFPTVLREAIRTTQTDIRNPSPLIKLAVQFGYGTGRGAALRQAADGAKPDPTLYRRTFEAHDRGSILVAAVFDGYFKLYQARIADLLRLATGGSGVLPPGAIHPDLVNRAADEAAGAADEILRACLRAFDYMPVLDPDFGDFLRAMITADYELNPSDRHGRRAALIEAFRARGIYPSGVHSLGEDALLLPDASAVGLPPLEGVVREMIVPELIAMDRLTTAPPEEVYEIGKSSDKRKSAIHDQLWGFGRRNADRLGLDGDSIEVSGFNPTFRVGEDGKLRTEMVVQWADGTGSVPALGGLAPAAGTTVVFSAECEPRYLIAKPWPHETLLPCYAAAAEERKARMHAFVGECDDRSPDAAWSDEARWEQRMLMRFGFASLHRGNGFT